MPNIVLKGNKITFCLAKIRLISFGHLRQLLQTILELKKNNVKPLNTGYLC